jgi:hypothetical protein
MNLSDLKKLADDATPGPWGYTYDGSNDYSIGAAEDPQAQRVASVYDPTSKNGANAAFIATFNPELVKKLLAVVEAAELVHKFEDSPDPRAPLLHDDAMFALGTALAEARKVIPKEPNMSAPDAPKT